MLVSQDNQEVLREMLESLAFICKEINASKLMMYSWDIVEIDIAKSLGYEYFDSNKCYMKSLEIGS